MIPSNLLGSQQALILYQCVNSTSPCVWIQGFLGSGKTVLLIHAMELFRKKAPGMSLCFVACARAHQRAFFLGGGLSDHIEALGITILTADDFIRSNKKYSIVFGDDIEDLEAAKLAKLKSLSDRLVITGGFEQSIYTDSVTESDVLDLLQPETYQLTVAYRLKQSLQIIARAILPNTSIAGAKISRGQDTDVVLAKADSDESEAAWIIKKADLLSKPGRPSVVILPKSDAIFNFVENVAIAKGVLRPKKVYAEGKYKKLDWDAINDYLRAKGIALRYLGSGFGDIVESDKTSITYVMTYHSSKGLDFAHVFLPQMNDGISLWKNDPEMEKRLFFVGVTRSRENLFISYSTEEPHELVADFPSKSIKQQSCEGGASSHSTDDDSAEIFF